MKNNKTLSFLPYLTYICLIVVSICLYQNIKDSQSMFVFRNNAYVEPNNPINIDDIESHKSIYPNDIFTIKEVIEKGISIPLEFFYNDLNWERQIYKEYWHSSYSRWSYIPHRIYYAMHRIFATYRTASVYYDFVHNLGVAYEAKGFTAYSNVNAYDYVELAVMQTKVSHIYTYGNQVVLVGKPQRTGLQLIPIPVKYINVINQDPNLLIQLATSAGDEVDYCTIFLTHINKEE